VPGPIRDIPAAASARAVAWRGVGAWTAGLLVVLAAALAPVLRDMVQVWIGRPELTHSFLVLPASLWFAWMRRRELRLHPVRPDLALGVPLLVVAAVMVRVGEVGGIVTLSSAGFVAVAFGLVLLLLGRTHLRLLLFPLAFLLFMTPLVGTLLEPLEWPFQQTTAHMAALILNAFHIPTYVNHQFIVLPAITLEVASECSGVSIFVSILALGLAVAYLSLRRWRSWAVLIGSALVIGVVANWLRVALIGIWAQMGGRVVHGPLHVLQAMSVAAVAYVALFVIAGVLIRREARRGAGSAPSPPGPPGVPVPFRAPGTAAWLAAVLVLGLMDAQTYALGVKPQPPRDALATLPADLGPWEGTGREPREAPFRVANADAELFRRYQMGDACVTDLYVGYLSSQRQGKELVSYRMDRLAHGPATRVVGTGAAALEVNTGEVPRRGEAPLPALYWYEIGGRVVADADRVMLKTLTGGLFHRRNNGALVLLISPDGDAAAWHRCLDDGRFIDRLLPALDRTL
jgi:EpsI family protein